MHLKKRIYVFWGIMDLLALASYVVLAIYEGRIPFVSDLINFTTIFSHYGATGGLAVWLLLQFLLGFLVRISLFYSAWSFIFKKEINTLFFMLQEAGRVITFTSSIPFLIVMVYSAGSGSVAMNFSIFIVSEILKIGTIIWCKTRSS